MNFHEFYGHISFKCISNVYVKFFRGAVLSESLQITSLQDVTTSIEESLPNIPPPTTTRHDSSDSEHNDSTPSRVATPERDPDYSPTSDNISDSGHNDSVRNCTYVIHESQDNIDPNLSRNLSENHEHDASVDVIVNENVENAVSNVSNESDLNETIDDTAQGGMPLEHGFLKFSNILQLFLENSSVHTKVPTGKKENVCFLVNNESNLDNRSQGGRSDYWDDCGVWNAGAPTTPTVYLCSNTSDGLVIKRVIVKKAGEWCHEKQINKKKVWIPLDPQPASEELLYVHRHYSNLVKPMPESGSYKKRVTWIECECFQFPKVALYEYIGTYPKNVNVQHGNAHTGANCYVRSHPETMKQIKDQVKTTKPRKVYTQMVVEAGPTNPVSAPNNRKQVENQRYLQNSKGNRVAKANFADHLQIVENMASDDDEPFVQHVIRSKGKSPIIIMYTKEQIADINRFCCSVVGETTVLGTDKTYNLGQVLVTATVFKHLALLNGSGQNPIFPGIMMIHANSDYPTFRRMWDTLHYELRKAPDAPQIGSDHEPALQDSGGDAFNNKKPPLDCTEHNKTNSRSRLRDDIGVGYPDRKEILGKIFGSEGVAVAKTQVLFDARTKVVEDLVQEKCPDFLPYFQNHVLPKLQRNLNQGHPNWMNNISESLNNLMKLEVNWEPQQLSNLVDILRNFVKAQYDEVERAIMGTGNFKLVPEYQRFFRTREKYCAMKTPQRNNFLTRFYNAPKIAINKSVSSSGLVSRVTASGGKKPGQSKRRRNAKTSSTPR